MRLFKLAFLFLFLCSAGLIAEDADETAPAESAVSSSVIEAHTAEVVEIEGLASIFRKTDQNWEKAAQGMNLEQGDQIAVSKDSTLVLEVDGSRLTISEGTLFTFNELSQNKEMKIWQGKIRAKVRKLGALESFKVLTPAAVCAVRGTEFSMENSPDKGVIVKNYEGLVSVKSVDSGKEMLVKKGEQCVLDPKSGKAVVSDIEEEQPETETQEQQPEPKKEKKKTEAAPSSAPGKGLGINGSMGADVLTDENGQDKIYYSLNLMPEIKFWKIGVGLDINLYFDEQGNLREEEWDGWEDVLPKILYVSYGNRGDSLYALLGGIQSYTLGNGFILNNYTNMLNYPEQRDKGLIVEMNFEKMGIQSICSNLDSYPVIGGRLYYRPLIESSLPLFSKLTLGITGVIDDNPDKNDATKDDGIIFYGADAGLPVLSFSQFDAALYADIASFKPGDAYNIDNPGSGWAGGLGGKIISIFNYGFEYRRLDYNFIPRYFDPYYEVSRAAKPLFISNSKTPSSEGPYGYLGVNLMNKLALSASYEDYNNDPENKYPYVHGELKVDPALLMNKYSLRISYDNTNVESFSDLSEMQGAIMTTEIGYSIAPNVNMYIIQKQTFDENGQPEKTLSFRTRFTF